MKRICVFCGSSPGNRPEYRAAGRVRDSGGVLRGGDVGATRSAREALRHPERVGYYSPLLAMFDHAVKERFLKQENRGLVLARGAAAELLRALEEWRPARMEKWLDRDTR